MKLERAFENNPGLHDWWTMGDASIKGSIPPNEKLVEFAGKTALGTFEPMIGFRGSTFLSIRLNKGTTGEQRREFETLVEAAVEVSISLQ